MVRGAWALILGVACADPSFDVPDDPPHDEVHDGARHGRLAKTPFRCPDPSPSATARPSARREEREVPSVRCVATATRPPDRLLSCDAAGCHGGYDFRDDPVTAARHLRGSNGPSCYTCHGEEWRSER